MFKALITEYSKCAERSTFTMHIALSHFHVFTIQNCISNNEILELTTYAVILKKKRGYSQFQIRAICLNEIRVKHRLLLFTKLSSSASSSCISTKPGLSSMDQGVMIWDMLFTVISFLTVCPSLTKPKFKSGSSIDISGPWNQCMVVYKQVSVLYIIYYVLYTEFLILTCMYSMYKGCSIWNKITI